MFFILIFFWGGGEHHGCCGDPDRQGRRKDSVSVEGIVDTFTTMLFATLGCDSDVHDVQHVTDMLVVVLGFW